MPRSGTTSSIARLCQFAMATAFVSSATPTIFQGNSIIITPSPSLDPREAGFQASNFYCYATDEGYLSFGWWLPAVPGNITHEHCRPNPESYDWFEYSLAGSCSATECRVVAVNYNSSNSSVPAFQERYVARLLDVGNGNLGNLALSYFDKANGGYAVGTRRVLSAAPENSASGENKRKDACRAALETFETLQKEHNIPLNFTLVDPCETMAADFGEL